MKNAELKGVSIQPILDLIDKHFGQFTDELVGVAEKMVRHADMQEEIKKDAAVCLFNRGVYMLGETAIRVAYKNDYDILKIEAGRMH